MTTGVSETSAARPSGSEPSALSLLSARHGLPEPDEGFMPTKDGARLRYAHWAASEQGRQGAVLYLNGRTEFIEKTLAAYAILCKSGLDIWTLDWRGQGLSTRSLEDRQKGHITDYQVYLDDLHHFVQTITDLPARRGKTIMLAHSMGGHIGLRYLHDHPGLIDQAVFSAPMIDLSVNKWPLRWLCDTIVRLNLGERYALGTGPFRFVYENPDDPDDNGTVEDYRERLAKFGSLTHDAAKFRTIQGILRAHPDLALGGPTATWLDATFRSLNLTWSPGYAETIETPLLIVGGGRDTVVITARQEAMVQRLAKGKFSVIDDAAHELLVECDDVRTDFLQQLANFTDINIDQPAVDMTGCARG